MVRALGILRCLLPSVGLFISASLWVASVLGATVPCGSQEFCSRVLASKLSSVGGIPTAAFGTVAYVLLILASAMTALATNERTSKYWFTGGYALSGLGTAASAGLTLFSVLSLRTTCPWCIGSAIVMTSTFGLYAWTAASSRHLDSIRDLRVLPLIGIATGASLIAVGIFTQRLRSDAATLGINLAALAHIGKEELIPPSAHAWGAEKPKYDLIFFGDLECPTCHVWFPRARDIVVRTGGRLIYRHCPLSIHPLAARAALVCEEAALHGRFAEAVDEAYSRDFDSNRLETLIVHYGADRASETTARARLASDEAVDKKLGITRTPTMVLVFADGRREPINLAELERRAGTAGRIPLKHG